MNFAGWHAIGRTWARAAGTVLAFSVAYLLADVFLNRFAFSDGWTIAWPLNGVTVALLLMRPRARWPWMMLGVELGTGVGEYLDNNRFGMDASERAISATEVLLSAWLLPPFESLERWLRTPGLFARFGAALLIGPGISGLMAAVLFHLAAGQSWFLAFNNWATADAIGMAATMPLVLSLGSPQMRNLFQREALPKTLGVLVVALTGAGMVFSVSGYPLEFLFYPLLLMVDSMLGFAGAAIAVAGALLIGVYFTTLPAGPFGTWPADSALPRDLALQIYFGFHMLALFPASIMLMERRRLAGELHATNQQLMVLASLDGLTGIANRRSFDERFAQEWGRAVRLRKPLALAMIDLDNFKQFNDLYGHLAGDRCLKSVAEALRSQVQRPEDFVTRFGGEEFALVLPHTAAEGARIVVERIRTAIEALNIDHIGNAFQRVTVSIGYSALIPTHSDGQSTLIQLADAALYQAKSSGRNRVETIVSIEGITAAKDHFSATSRNRIVGLLGRNDR